MADGQMSVLPVAFSLMASFMSAITLLGVTQVSSHTTGGHSGQLSPYWESLRSALTLLGSLRSALTFPGVNISSRLTGSHTGQLSAYEGTTGQLSLFWVSQDQLSSFLGSHMSALILLGGHSGQLSLYLGSHICYHPTWRVSQLSYHHTGIKQMSSYSIMVRARHLTLL
jgi:hypothetical protein